MAGAGSAAALDYNPTMPRGAASRWAEGKGAAVAVMAAAVLEPRVRERASS